MSAAVSTHFVAEKVKALCVVSDVRYASSETLQDQFELLPLVATGGWDNEASRQTRGANRSLDPRANELVFGFHVGDVNALEFVAAKGDNLLVSASSAGGVLAYRVAASSSREDAAMPDDEAPLSPLAIPQWENLFADTAATCLEVSESRTSVVTASAGGAIAWLALDDVMGVEKIDNKETSGLPINAVKMLGRDSVVATVGSVPGSQLRIWDLTTSNQFPITTCAESILLSLETHPTRPELLVTGADDGRVSFWDRRRLDAPFRTEAHHQRAVRALKLHAASPRYLYTGGDDVVVNCWDFHHGRRPRDPVEYERVSSNPTYSQSLSTTVNGPSVANGFYNGPVGLKVQPLASGFQPWNALAVHAESDTLVAGSDAQSVLIVQQVSKWGGQQP
ncbi:hypothetical protein BBJ28_00021306 [Nothophytophthora sp. Chile5]|nr:hypothetical protein BBJ28_00021306 [Nothophytophthora sp. Chile5]